MNILNKKRLLLVRRFIIELIQILIGSSIMAAGTSFFMLPNQLSTGGFAGIATITYYLFKFPMGLTIFILNLPLFILAIYKLGKKFFINTLIGVIAFSFFIDFFDKFTPLTNDRFLACIYGGIVTGLGSAIILKVKSTTGGTELLTSIIKSYNSSFRISAVIVIIDVIIVSLNVIFFKKIEIGLYSAISIYIMGKILDIFFEGIYYTKLLFIISEKNEEIAKEIGQYIKKGTTGLYGKGMYTRKDKLVLLCAASRGDVIKVKETAKKIDPKSFIIISPAKEVFGIGFKKG